MGIFCAAFAVSDRTIETLLQDPLLVWQVVEHEDYDTYLQAVQEANRQPIFRRLLGKVPPPVRPRRLDFTGHELKALDLDKSWDGLDRTLRTLWRDQPSFFESGREIGKLEVGLGPALFHSSAAMGAFALTIGTVSEQQFLSAFERTDLSQAYLDRFWERRDNDVVEYITEHFSALQEFVRHAAAHSLGAVMQFG
ncbi:DUF1877 family protein [Azohydromonas aeria]|uniref:DUF1877 family protein n=1 Tax=Azohydromonas aeria TaxID=2590212 RepID=UPI0012F7FF39|nr:DUF1877 family protein [Azohydromonas aeria]